MPDAAQILLHDRGLQTRLLVRRDLQRQSQAWAAGRRHQDPDSRPRRAAASPVAGSCVKRWTSGSIRPRLIGHESGGRPCQAAAHVLDDGVAIDGVADRMSHAPVRENRVAHVEADVGEVETRRRLDAKCAVLLSAGARCPAAGR